MSELNLICDWAFSVDVLMWHNCSVKSILSTSELTVYQVNNTKISCVPTDIHPMTDPYYMDIHKDDSVQIQVTERCRIIRSHMAVP